MDKKQFLSGIEKLEMAYNQKFDTKKLVLWYSKLNSMPVDKFLKRIDELIPTKEYMPNIAEILDKKRISSNYTNYEQRSYSDIDFNQFYANKGGDNNEP